MSIEIVPEGFDTPSEDSTPVGVYRYDVEGRIVAIPLVRRVAPTPTRSRLRVEYRDLLFVCPWAICIGIVFGRLALPAWSALIAAVAYGVLFSLYLKGRI